MLCGDRVESLSTLDNNFKKSLEEQAQALGYVGAVALHANPESQMALSEGVGENELYMRRASAFPSLSPDQLRRIIASSADRARDFAMSSGAWIEL